MLKARKKIAPKAALLTCVNLDLSDKEDEDEKTETDDEGTEIAFENEENTIPEFLTSFFDPFSINYNDSKLTNLCQNKYEAYTNGTTKKQYKDLEELTKIQSDSDKWMLYRTGRITPSNCKKAFVMDITILSSLQSNL